MKVIMDALKGHSSKEKLNLQRDFGSFSVKPFIYSGGFRSSSEWGPFIQILREEMGPVSNIPDGVFVELYIPMKRQTKKDNHTVQTCVVSRFLLLSGILIKWVFSHLRYFNENRIFEMLTRHNTWAFRFPICWTNIKHFYVLLFFVFDFQVL